LFGESAETPDFVVDCLANGWADNKPDYPEITTLAINLDSGGATRSNRTQFALEQFWHGAILDSVEPTLAWASHMMWKGLEPVVYRLSGTYEKGITVDSPSLAEFRVDWHPSEFLPRNSCRSGRLRHNRYSGEVICLLLP